MYIWVSSHAGQNRKLRLSTHGHFTGSNMNLWVSHYSLEMKYSGALVLSELITGAVTYINVSGKGSADEQHVHLL